MTIKTRTRRVRSTCIVTTKFGGDPSGVDAVARNSIQTGLVTDIRIGSENPQWRSQVRHSINAGTGYVATFNELQPGDGMFFMSWKPSSGSKYIYSVQRNGWLYGAYPVVTDASGVSVPSALDKQARVNFLQQVRNARTAFQGGTFFGELAETVHMIRHPVESLRKSVTAYIRTAKKRAGRVNTISKYLASTKRVRQGVNRALRDTYLEWRFGALPLLADASDALHLLDADPNRIRETFSARASTETIAGTELLHNASLPISNDAKVVQRVHVSVGYKGALDAVSGSLPSFQEQLGFVPSNFFPTVWNLIPYSFLVDYFSNVGKVIDAIALGSVSLTWGVKTIWVEQNKILIDTSSFSGVGNGVVLNRIGIPPSMTWKSVHHERQAISGVDVDLSDITFKIPSIQSPWKWLNIGALALNALPR